MRKYRKLLISAFLFAMVAGGIYLYWQRQAAPRMARVLPDGDRLLYVDVRPLRLWDWSKSSPVHLEGDYQEFVDQTGIRFERDLDQAAVSWHDLGTGDAEAAALFAARFDPAKLKSYLQKISAQTESYHNLTVYVVPHEGHTVRVSLLDPETVAITNAGNPDMIHGMIDRWNDAPAGPALLAQYYTRVPIGSLGWLIDRIPRGSSATQLPAGLSFSFLEGTVAVVSAGYDGALRLRADVFAASEDDARRITDSANGFLGVYRSVSRTAARGGDPDVKAALDSIRVEQNGNAALFTASLSNRFLKKIAAEAQQQGVPAPSSLPSPSKQR